MRNRSRHCRRPLRPAAWLGLSMLFVLLTCCLWGCASLEDSRGIGCWATVVAGALAVLGMVITIAKRARQRTDDLERALIGQMRAAEVAYATLHQISPGIANRAKREALEALRACGIDERMADTLHHALRAHPEIHHDAGTVADPEPHDHDTTTTNALERPTP